MNTFPPPPDLPPPAGAGRVRAGGGLARLWQDHLAAPFPGGFRGVDVDGVDLVLLDADVAGLVRREAEGGLDGPGIARLRYCIADLDRIVPLLDEEYCASYFVGLRAMALTAAARHIPTAT
ncbi:hypothetical protein ACWDR0_15730 [Streptomyces sp. NPDC003691]